MDLWLPRILSLSNIHKRFRQRILPCLRGLRQGDLFAPFLFTLVADAFSQILKNGENSNLIQGFRIGKESIPISHLQYATSTLLSLDGGKRQLLNLIS